MSADAKSSTNMIHYAIWPEGMPEAARYTTSAARAFILQNAMGLAFLFPFKEARKICTAQEKGRRPDPESYEALLCEQSSRDRGNRTENAKAS